MIKEDQQRFPKLSIFIYGHSLGGNIVLDSCLRKESRMQGAVVTEPSLQLAIDPLASKVFLGNLFNSAWLPYAQASGVETVALSWNPQVVQMYIDDPLVHDRVSVRMFVGFYEAGLI